MNDNEFIHAFKKYNKQIYRFIYFRVGQNKQIAEDITQEVFLKAFRHNKKQELIPSTFRGWLYHCARNEIIDLYRKNKNKSDLDFDDAPTESIDTEMNLDQMSLYKAINDLSSKDQELIILKYIEGFKIDEIAEIIDKSNSATKMAINRAFYKLKKILNGQ